MVAKKQPKRAGFFTVTVKLPAAMYEDILALSLDEDRSTAGQIRYLLAQALETVKAVRA